MPFSFRINIPLFSRPRLSRKRHPDEHNDQIAQEKGPTNKTRIVHKSVQFWIDDISYSKMYPNLSDFEVDNTYTINFPNMFALSKKIERATGLNTTAKYASTDFQTTNYGLGGLCETHFDPYGYTEGAQLPDKGGFLKLRRQGDMMATMMGWLEDVPAGGATAFSMPYHETLVWPERGSAAFWFNLDKKGHKDKRLLHGGCPIIKGSKWIVNKWIYYFDQFHTHPCSLGSGEYIKPFSQHY